MNQLAAVRSHLDRLVAFDTTSSGSNVDVVNWLANHLDRPGVTVWDLPDPVTTLDGEVIDQHNVLVRIGPEAPGGTVLSAHLDCVPVTGQPWTTDPFTVDERDGRLYGRGTCDMKGFLATCLGVLDGMDPASLQRPIILALSHSEELGTLGAPALTQALVQRIEAPELAIVGEPTMMEVIGAHKGVRGAWVTVDGVDGHSSLPNQGASANVAAARLVTHVDDLAIEHEQAGPYDDRFHPPMTTFNVGLIRGGEAINIIPRQARLYLEYRPIPAVDGDEILQAIQAYADQELVPLLGRDVGPDKVAITFRPDANVLALQPESDGIAASVARACGAMGETDQTVAYGTDGGWLQQAGMSVVVCGPGSIEQAHRPDEFLAVEQLAAGTTFVQRVVSRALQAG